jgi:hypothetical protein
LDETSSIKAPIRARQSHFTLNMAQPGMVSTATSAFGQVRDQ